MPLNHEQARALIIEREQAKAQAEGDHEGRQLEWERCENKRLRELSEFQSAVIDKLVAKPKWDRANDVEATSAINTMLRLGYTYTGAGEWMKNLFSCNTCNDQGVVDDGELTHSEGGTPYENGPIKCVKDCPDCTRAVYFDHGKPGSDMTAKATFRNEGGKLTLESIERSEPQVWAPTITLSLEEARKFWSSHGAPFKPCAARIGGVDCQASRADDSLFCGRHRHADNRQKRAPLTNEGLAFMMQRDGEQQ